MKFPNSLLKCILGVSHALSSQSRCFTELKPKQCALKTKRKGERKKHETTSVRGVTKVRSLRGWASLPRTAISMIFLEGTVSATAPPGVFWAHGVSGHRFIAKSGMYEHIKLDKPFVTLPPFTFSENDGWVKDMPRDRVNYFKEWVRLTRQIHHCWRRGHIFCAIEDKITVIT